MLTRRRLLYLMGWGATRAPQAMAQAAGVGGAPEVKLPLRNGSTRFCVIGDNGTGDGPQYQVAQQMERFRQVVKFDFVPMMGDNIYGGHKPDDFYRKFELPYKPLLDAGVTFYGCLGNHDDPDRERNYKPFNMGGQRYYNYTRGPIEFFVMDSNYMDPRQVGWLEGKLKESKARWKFAYFHHPLFTNAKFHGPDLDLRAQLMPLFTKYGMNVVMYGHEHVYERVKPQQGIYFFLMGSSGQLRYKNLHKSQDLDIVGLDTDQAFLLMEIAGDELFFQAVKRTGEIFDAGVLRHQGA